MDMMDDSDCYCQYYLSTDLKKQQVKSTKVIENSLNPDFNEEQILDLKLLERETKVCKLCIVVKDKDVMVDEDIGFIYIDLLSIF